MQRTCEPPWCTAPNSTQLMQSSFVESCQPFLPNGWYFIVDWCDVMTIQLAMGITKPDKGSSPMSRFYRNHVVQIERGDDRKMRKMKHIQCTCILFSCVSFIFSSIISNNFSALIHAAFTVQMMNQNKDLSAYTNMIAGNKYRNAGLPYTKQQWSYYLYSRTTETKCCKMMMNDAQVWRSCSISDLTTIDWTCSSLITRPIYYRNNKRSLLITAAPTTTKNDNTDI